MSDVTMIDERVDALLGQLTLTEKVALLSGKSMYHTVPIERLGIPSAVLSDGPHGVRANDGCDGRITGPTTCFPTGSALAATWNPALIERVGAALGEEAHGMGCDVLLGPCINIVRHPLGGRNFESYSEDPYLAGRIAVGWIRGLQSQGVGASLKHYACNNQETERMRGDSIVDERTLREIYLPAFEMAVKEADPWTIIGPYNRVNGVYCSQHDYLLNRVLREEWGFKGAVISDWSGTHAIFESMQGGLDLEMPGPAKYLGGFLADAVRNWQIEEAVIDRAARRILRLLALTGRLDDATRGGSVNTPAHQALAREAAAEAIVLLKNDGVLPLQNVSSLAVIGPNAATFLTGGGGSSFVEPPYRISPLQGLQERLGEQVRFAQGCDNFVKPPLINPEYLCPAQGEGPGLWAEYFAGADCTGTPVMARVEPTINFWSGGLTCAPDELLGETFSVRWRGTLTAPGAGRHVVNLINTGDCRLYLDDRLILDNTRSGAIDFVRHINATVDVELDARREYAFRLEFTNAPGDRGPAAWLHFAYAPDEAHDSRIADAVELARACEVAVVVVGLPDQFERESGDRPHMDLTGRQNALVEAVAAANPNTVVVVNAGSPVTMPWLDRVPAVVLALYPGQEGGRALVDILLGDINPSGKLPVTFPRRLQDTPAYINFPGTREVRYGEGIFVGYRYYDMREMDVLFPFGHGLSYTQFRYSDLDVPASAKIGEPVTVTLTVANTGSRPGKETVQLYVTDLKSSEQRPPKELKAFAKINLLPCENQSLSFILDRRAFAYYDPYMKEWVVEPGEFEILVGSSSRDIRARAKLMIS